VPQKPLTAAAPILRIEPVPAESFPKEIRVRRAQAMSCDQKIAGAIAFFRRGSPDLGEFEDAVILKAFGEVPDDLARA
jgi:hypothetical protein